MELSVLYVYKRQLPLVSSQIQFFCLQVLLNRHLLLLTWSFIKQSVLKQLLTEGEKHEVASYHSCHLAAICYENFFHLYKIDLFFSTKVLIFISLWVHCALFGALTRRSKLKILSGSVIERSMPDKWCPFVLITYSFSMPGIVPTLP